MSKFWEWIFWFPWCNNFPFQSAQNLRIKAPDNCINTRVSARDALYNEKILGNRDTNIGKHWIFAQKGKTLRKLAVKQKKLYNFYMVRGRLHENTQRTDYAESVTSSHGWLSLAVRHYDDQINCISSANVRGRHPTLLWYVSLSFRKVKFHLQLHPTISFDQ